MKKILILSMVVGTFASMNLNARPRVNADAEKTYPRAAIAKCADFYRDYLWYQYVQEPSLYCTRAILRELEQKHGLRRETCHEMGFPIMRCSDGD